MQFFINIQLIGWFQFFGYSNVKAGEEVTEMFNFSTLFPIMHFQGTGNLGIAVKLKN